MFVTTKFVHASSTHLRIALTGPVFSRTTVAFVMFTLLTYTTGVASVNSSPWITAVLFVKISTLFRLERFLSPTIANSTFSFVIFKSYLSRTEV